MSAQIIPFLVRGPLTVRVIREGRLWLVVCRDHGWLHADHSDAMEDAEAIAEGFGVSVSEAHR
jgi:hypothetical protein